MGRVGGGVGGGGAPGGTRMQFQAGTIPGNTGQTVKKNMSIAPSSSQAEPPKELTLDLGGDVVMKLALIPAGKFMMGEEKEQYKHQYIDQHEVTISKPSYMGVTEVTQALCVPKTPSGVCRAGDGCQRVLSATTR
jgi:hypothetical protein